MHSTPRSELTRWSCALDGAPAWPWTSGLFVFAGLVQLLMATQAVVPAQDAARHVAYAQAIERDGFWPTVIERNEAPGFPTLVWLLHGAASCLAGDPPALWAMSVQGAAMLAVALCAPPLFLLLRPAFGTVPAMLGVALAMASSELARVGADGLSDGLFLCLTLWGLWLALAHAGRWMAPLAGGITLGLSFLTRLEAAVLLPALVWAIFRNPAPRERLGWRPALCVAAGFALVAAGFCGATGKLTPKHSASFLTHLAAPATGASVDTSRRHAKPAEVIPLKEAAVTSREYGYLAATEGLLRDFPQAVGYLSGVLVLIGLWLTPRSQSPAWDTLVRWFVPGMLLGAWHFAAVAGYLSPRHFLLPALLLAGWAGVGLNGVCLWCERWITRSQTPGLAAPATGLALCLMALLAVSLRPLHASRLGHREAGDWLAATAQPDESVLDTRLWTGLYSGLPTYGIDRAPVAAADPRLRYVVVEAEELERDSSRGRALRRFVAGFASPGLQPASFQPAAEFPTTRGAQRDRARKVYVFRRASAP